MQTKTLLLGRGRKLERGPADAWEKNVIAAPSTTAARFAFMTGAHRAVREAAVLHLPGNRGRPLTPRQLSHLTSLPETSIDAILNDLHRNLFFLVQNGRGHVSWAFPVTIDRTAHIVRFSSGERLWAA